MPRGKNSKPSPEKSIAEEDISVNSASGQFAMAPKRLRFWEQDDNMDGNHGITAQVPGAISSLNKTGFVAAGLVARVSSKSEMRQWNSKNGAANVFSFTLMDQDSEVMVTAYRDEADKFFPLLEFDRVVKLTNFTVKLANPQFNPLGCNWELVLTKSSQVIIAQSDLIGPLRFDFKSVAAVSALSGSEVFDFIGICVGVGDIEQVNDTSGGTVDKRVLKLLGEINIAQIDLTLWGQKATDFDVPEYSVIVVRHGVAKSFQGINSIGIHSYSAMLINPDIDAANNTLQWFQEKMEESRQDD